MTAPIRVRPIQSAAERQAFIKFQWRVYAGNPYWVPPLLSERATMLDPQRNPFHQHAEVQLFVAERGGEIVGTVAALVNHRHNEYHHEKTGFFGFFEVLDDYDVAAALLDTAREWVRTRSMERLRGPASFSTNEEVGLLLDHYDQMPGILTVYNPPYYVDFVERYGLRKVMDLWQYRGDVDDLGPEREFPPKLLRVVELARKRSGVTLRRADMSNFRAEVERLKQVYNAAWQDNWGFVPLTDAEINYLADGLKQFVDPHLIILAEKDGEPVGVSLALPDMHQVLYHIRDGKLFPTGWLKFLYYRRKIDRVRYWALGVVEGYRHRGVDALLYYETAKATIARNYRHIEMGWVLENNEMMNQISEAMGAKRYKTFRLYEMPL